MQLPIRPSNKSYNSRTSGPQRQNLTIGLLPHELDANKYIAENYRILSKIGVVKPVPKPVKLMQDWLRHVVTTKKISLYDVLIVNWRENCLTKSNKIRLSGILEYIISIALHRACSKKLIYVRHNKHPHDLEPTDISKAKFWIKFGEYLSDKTVFHSPIETTEPHHMYVPHPLYTKSISRSITSDVVNSKSSEQSYFLMFGRIEPYKQIHLVIEKWSEKHNLRIVGPCSDNRYLASLENLADGKPVYIEPEFQPDDELAQKVRKARGVIIANHEDSMITSGSFFYSLSCGTPVFALSNPFYSWVNNSARHSIVYTSPDISNLISMIDDASLESLRREDITISANHLFSDREIENCWRKVIVPEK